MDEDGGRQLAVKEVWIDPNFSNDTRKVKIKYYHLKASSAC